MPRVEFPKPIRQAVAERVGYRCSFPMCETVTLGPSEEGDAAVARTGMACHILAASSGPAARRVANDQSFDLASISNAIWMCYRHGKLIDADECRYEAETLRGWKEIGERRARLSHEFGKPVALNLDNSQALTLAPDNLDISSPESIYEAVFDVFRASCASELWGEQVSYAVRDVCIELIENSFQHGSSTKCTLSSDYAGFTIRENGSFFSIEDLAMHPQGRGGAKSIEELRNRHPNVFVEKRAAGGVAETRIIFASSGRHLSMLTPCTIEFSGRHVCPGHTDMRRYDLCETVYLVPVSGVSYSLVEHIRPVLEELTADGKKICLIDNSMSDGVREAFVNEFPDIKIILASST